MNRNTKFSARFSPEDQTLLIHVAARLHRSKSDAVRILIHEKAAELGLLNESASYRSKGYEKNDS
jgi:hypothetical protein